MSSIKERSITLIDKAGINALIRKSDIGYSRWHGVKYKGLRISTEELEVLKDVFPQYALWLITGDVAPEIGQTSPDYDEANGKLKQHGEG